MYYWARGSPWPNANGKTFSHWEVFFHLSGQTLENKPVRKMQMRKPVFLDDKNHIKYVLRMKRSAGVKH